MCFSCHVWFNSSLFLSCLDCFKCMFTSTPLRWSKMTCLQDSCDLSVANEETHRAKETFGHAEAGNGSRWRCEFDSHNNFHWLACIISKTRGKIKACESVARPEHEDPRWAACQHCHLKALQGGSSMDHMQTTMQNRLRRSRVSQLSRLIKTHKMLSDITVLVCLFLCVVIHCKL